MADFTYNRIPLIKAEEVTLISKNAQEYINYKKKLYDKKNKSKKDREQIILDNPELSKQFQEIFEGIINKDKQYKPHKDPSKHFAGTVKIGKSSKGHILIKNSYNQKEIIKRIFEETFFNYDEKGWQVNNKTKKEVISALEKEGITCYESKNAFLKKAIDLDIPEESTISQNDLKDLHILYEGELKKKRERKIAGKFAYCATLCRVDEKGWHPQRVEAFLRDIDSNKMKKTSPGKGGKDFEEKVRRYLDRIGLENKKCVFKVKTRNRNTKYKEMDYHTEISGHPCIIEIFTNRNAEEKHKQIRNYTNLFKEATGTRPKNFLLTTNSDGLMDFETFKFLVNQIGDF